MKRNISLLIVFFAGTVWAALNLNIEVGSPGLIEKDPYRAAYQNEAEIFNWLIAESTNIISEEKLKVNKSISPVSEVLDPKSISKINTIVDFATWELTLGQSIEEA